MKLYFLYSDYLLTKYKYHTSGSKLDFLITHILICIGIILSIFALRIVSFLIVLISLLIDFIVTCMIRAVVMVFGSGNYFGILIYFLTNVFLIHYICKDKNKYRV